jgi:hypothetical protein
MTLLHFSDYDYSWLAQFFSLLVLPFAYEDLAIILGGYIVVNKIMPVGLVPLCTTAAWSRATSLCTGSARARGAYRGSRGSRLTTACLRRAAQAQSVRDRRALPRCSRCRVHRLRRMRLDARAARPFHAGDFAGIRALPAAHALHRGVLRRRAR